VRRIVLISDGQANVGPSSPQALGELAGRSLALDAQVTSVGVGLDYDERTLDAIAEHASGRLFHVGDPREMRATLEGEFDLLRSTVATDAAVEVVPAPGVQLLDIEGARGERGGNGTMRIPLGSLFAGQHREALVRVRLNESAPGTQRALASVRLTFRDPAENGLQRVQEVLARASTTTDPSEVAARANAKTQAMMATVEAARTELRAAQDLGAGNFAQAQTQLAQAEQAVRTQAATTKDPEARRKLDATAQSLATASARAAAAPKAAPSAVRESTLQMNGAAMKSLGY
jgi:Ca-activated chloride channel family protein